MKLRLKTIFIIFSCIVVVDRLTGVRGRLIHLLGVVAVIVFIYDLIVGKKSF